MSDKARTAAPDEIYLQGVIGSFNDNDVTWCQDLIENDDVRYLRAPETGLEPVPCPSCGSGDVGGASGIVHCYKCKLEVKRETTALAVLAWNERAPFLALAAPMTVKEISAELSRDDFTRSIAEDRIRNPAWFQCVEMGVRMAEKRPREPETPIELRDVAQVLAEGGGFWRSCSGCHESEDGHPVGDYPHSEILKCDLGGGCSECGGIGAVWDNTDYDAMGRAFEAELNAEDQLKAEPRRFASDFLERFLHVSPLDLWAALEKIAPSGGYWKRSKESLSYDWQNDDRLAGVTLDAIQEALP